MSPPAPKGSNPVHPPIHPGLRTDRVRLVGLVFKKPSMSQEEFERYRLENHSKLIMSLDIVKRNLIRYEQFCINPEAKVIFQKLGIPLIDCDGGGILEGESYEKILEIFDDPEYQAIIPQDEENFIIRSKTQLIPVDFMSFIDK